MRGDLVLRVVGKLLIPFILLFALYVQFHGDFGPGGGFQAGVIFAAAIVFYALIFGLINALVRPITKLVTLPAIIVTLGLFIFVVNALMLELTSWVADKLDIAFHVDEFWWDAVLGSLIITFVAMILGFFNPVDDD